MIRVESRQMLGSVISVIRCYHGWQDPVGHIIATDLCDIDGESQEQMLVAAYDAINRILKDRTNPNCQYAQDHAVDMS